VSESEFQRVVDRFYEELRRGGVDQVLLQAGTRVLVVRDCHKQLADRWDDLAEVVGRAAPRHLRYIATVIRRMMPQPNKATFLDIDLTVASRIEVAAGVSIDVLC
jgi:hypothetical protein